MKTDRRSQLARLLAACSIAGGCQSFEVTTTQFGIFNIATEVNGEDYTATPRAVFFEGTGVSLSSTDVTSEGCIVRPVEESGVSPLDQIEAGPSINVRLSDVDATLTPQSALGRITYELADGAQMPFTPGDTVTFTVPGAPNGFPPRVVAARTAEAFTPAAITLPASLDENVTVTWTSETTVAPRSAMFYSFRYSMENATTLNREVFCVFADDGSGVVPASSLQGFRAAVGERFQERSIVAQRARVTIESEGTVVTHVTSSLTRPVALTAAP